MSDSDEESSSRSESESEPELDARSHPLEQFCVPTRPEFDSDMDSVANIVIVTRRDYAANPPDVPPDVDAAVP